ncbi:SRPBCC family protein [Saccharopolyspora cebuensis]|uniref:SRPBCC family protein n=1 Tax=Saccharopolyspora cebuensis TaxID=418759 RepID=A0ABV4CJI7_9PSEU
MAEREDDPVGRLEQAARGLLDAAVSRLVGVVEDKVDRLADRLTDVVDNDGSGLAAALTGGGGARQVLGSAASKVKEKATGSSGGSGGGGGGGGGGGKVVNIVENVDVGLPLRVVYDQWTQFGDYPEFTRKVESVEHDDDATARWRAQIFLSHRTWTSTIVEQVPDERIVWRSEGAKGSVDGAVTFHELTPTLTRVLLVLEYRPDGFLEKTAALWRAQGRRARADFRHIKRHMMTRTILEQEDTPGWRGEIRDEEVVRSHEDAMSDDQGQDQDQEQEQEPEQERAPRRSRRR